MTFLPKKMRDWLMANRTSVRLAFGLRIISMVVSSPMSLVWTRALLHVLGNGVYGLFLSFQSVARLGGLGDFGISSALAVRTSQAFGHREEEKLRPFLASARSLFLLMGTILSVSFLALSPWLPGWLGFKPEPGAGSLHLLFLTGGLGLFVVVVSGYFNSLNSAYGTMWWPIIPMLLLSQLATAAQWMSAGWGAPLWVQNLIGLGMVGITGMFLVWGMLKVSHPWLGNLRPISFDFAIWRDLAGTSGWMYLYCLGGAIYWTTDRLLINAGFGATVVPKYLLNYKLCELSVQIILTASFVSMPKITRWIASPEPDDRIRVIAEIKRLNIFQTMLGCIAALGYLALNDVFMRFWLGDAYIAPQWWQFAFALNLAVTASGDTGVQVAGICGSNGIRRGGLTIFFTGLLNFVLSFISMKLGYIAGIAMATVLAQSVQGLILGWFTCSYLSFKFQAWSTKCWVLPILTLTAACWLRFLFPPHTIQNILILLGSDVVLIMMLALCIGFNLDLVRHEWQIVQKMLAKKT